MKGVLVDLDGVVYNGDKLIDGADDTVRWLQNEQIPHLFVTNTSWEPRQAIVDRLTGFDIEVKPEEILTPAVASAQWLCEHNVQTLVLLTPERTKSDFIGFETLPLAMDHDEHDGSTPCAIVVGDMGSDWNYTRLNLAFRYLMRSPKPHLIALGMTRYAYSSSGLNLDVAPFVKALECASETEAVVLGKPSKTFFDEALHILGMEASQVCVVGNDIRSDIKGAQDAGIKGMLVKTGKYRPEDLNLNIEPDYVLDSLNDLPGLLQ